MTLPLAISAPTAARSNAKMRHTLSAGTVLSRPGMALGHYASSFLIAPVVGGYASGASSCGGVLHGTNTLHYDRPRGATWWVFPSLPDKWRLVSA